MDSLSQAVLGAAVMAASLPAHQRRRGLIAGALLGTVPDLDTFIVPLFTQTPVDLFTWHRGPSHALWLLLLLALLIWWVGKRHARSVQEAPRAWLLGITLALLTHPILDAFTVYGTQLWWPSNSSPVMWGSLFIIDPLYTLPLLVAVVIGLLAGATPCAGKALIWGLALSTAYIGWSLTSQALTDRAIRPSLQAQGLAEAPRLVINTPLNTLLWRVIVMQDGGYSVGYHSVFDGQRALALTHYPSESELLQQIAAVSPDVQRLLWFTSGYMAAEVVGRHLVLHDLRMGTEGGFVFSFLIAENRAPADQPPQWQALLPAQPAPRATDIGSRMRDEAGTAWQRLTGRHSAP